MPNVIEKASETFLKGSEVVIDKIDAAELGKMVKALVEEAIAKLRGGTRYH